MDRKARRTLLCVVIPLATLLALFVGLLETALFQINPVKIGFNRFDFQGSVVFSRGSVGSFDYSSIPTIMKQNEATHGMRYRLKVQVIICSQSEINRYLPFIDPSDRRIASSFAEWPNTVYLTPNSELKYGTSQGPMAHELSHLLLIQNYGVARIAFLQKHQEWIPEGFATYLTNFPDYFPPDQLKEAAVAAGIDMSNGRLFGSKHDGDYPFKVRFMVYRGFVAYLFRMHSSSTVIRFLKEACANPTEVQASFEDIFNESLVTPFRISGKDYREHENA